MAEVFTWRPVKGVSGDVAFATNEIQFGDGYEQATKRGINNRKRTWELTFEGNSAAINPIAAFLDARGGAESFWFVDPRGQQGLWRCKSYRPESLGGGVFRIVASFKEVFRP